MKWSARTTPSSKHSLFTPEFFSTKSFGPGHLVGVGVLVVGTYTLAKAFVARGRAASDRTRRLAQANAQGVNARGQYGGP